VSKERARRRAERQAIAERERASRARKVRRRAALRRVRTALRPKLPDRGRTGRLYARRTRTERAGIVVAALLAVSLVWLFVEPLGLRIAITAMLLIAAPALVVIAFDRRS